jgi:hypothetical protein
MDFSGYVRDYLEYVRGGHDSGARPEWRGGDKDRLRHGPAKPGDPPGPAGGSASAERFGLIGLQDRHHCRHDPHKHDTDKRDTDKHDNDHEHEHANANAKPGLDTGSGDLSYQIISRLTVDDDGEPRELGNV